MREGHDDEYVLTRKIIWRYTPTEAEQSDWRLDVAQDYAIEEDPDANCGVILWAKYNGKWNPNPWSPRPVLRQLLAERATALQNERTAIAKAIDKMHADCPDKEARLWLWAAARAVEERGKE